jgi:hypothetical protein
MGKQVRQIVHRKLFQSFRERQGIPGGFHGEAVRFVFVFPGKHLQKYPEYKIDARIKHAKKDEPGVDRFFFHEKSLEKQPAFQKPGQKIKHDTAVNDGKDQAFYDVSFFVMSHFMGQNGDKLGDGVAFNQGVEKCDPLVFSKTGKKGVGL